jgi:hypothetical protein
MSVLATTHPTMLDMAKRLDPGGKVTDIVEMLTQTNPILEDMVVVEGNLPTGHKTTVRTGLPAPTWRKLYGGVQPTKSTTAQVTDSCGMLEAYAEVDKALADLNGNTAAFRLSEDRAHIEGMNQEMSSSMFYATETTEPEAFTGLAPRFNSLSAANAENIIRPRGVTLDGTDNTSIWLVVWGPNTVHGIVPKGSKVGLQQEDKGQVTIENVDGAGGRMEAYRSHYRWDLGLTVRDWRYVVRIQIDAEDLTETGATGPVLNGLLARALNRIPALGMGRPVFYANRDVLDFVDAQAASNARTLFNTIEDAQGKYVTRFRGVPIKRSDAITSTEAAIV